MYHIYFGKEGGKVLPEVDNYISLELSGSFCFLIREGVTVLEEKDSSWDQSEDKIDAYVGGGNGIDPGT